MATLSDLRAALDLAAPGRCTVRLITQKDRAKFVPATRVTEARSFASATALVGVSDYPEDYAVDIDAAVLALVGAAGTPAALAALESAGTKLDLRRAAAPAQQPGDRKT
jgi:hypothetical protein